MRKAVWCLFGLVLLVGCVVLVQVEGVKRDVVEVKVSTEQSSVELFSKFEKIEDKIDRVIEAVNGRLVSQSY